MIDVANLYVRHGAMAFRRARRLLKDEQAARDVVHDVFMVMHERREELELTGIVSWLYVATTNLCLQRLRNAATRARLVSALEPAQHAPALGEDRAAIRAMLETLPEDIATVAVYRFVDEMTHAEIAEVMGCSRRHIGNLLNRLERAMEPARAHA